VLNLFLKNTIINTTKHPAMKATILQVAIFCLQALQLTGFSAIDVRAVGATGGSFGAARA